MCAGSGRNNEPAWTAAEDDMAWHVLEELCTSKGKELALRADWRHACIPVSVVDTADRWAVLDFAEELRELERLKTGKV